MPDTLQKQIPDGISREHILRAIARFDSHGLPTGFRPSHTYEVRHNGNAYSPPAIVALAAKDLTGTILPVGFRAGKGSHWFQVLENGGSTIYQKRSRNA